MYATEYDHKAYSYTEYISYIEFNNFDYNKALINLFLFDYNNAPM